MSEIKRGLSWSGRYHDIAEEQPLDGAGRPLVGVVAAVCKSWVYPEDYPHLPHHLGVLIETSGVPECKKCAKKRGAVNV